MRMLRSEGGSGPGWRGWGSRAAHVLALLLIFATVTSSCGGPDRQTTVERPRVVVLIGVDTLRADHLGLYGAARPTSPFLDQFAEQGVVFDLAFATSPWTLPSFASILTGRLQSGHAAGMRLANTPDEWEADRIGPGRRIILDPAVSTLAEHLSAAGFATVAVAQNPNLDAKFGVGRGFDIYDHHTGSYESTRASDVVVDLGFEYVDSHPDESLFLFLHFWDPHMQYGAPEPYGGMFTDGLEGGFTLPVVEDPGPIRRDTSGLSPARKAFMEAAYDEEIRFVDSQFERVVEGLKGRGLWDHALLIFVADHGEELFDHGGFEHGHTLYNEVLHVPLIIWGPGITPRRSAKPVSIADITPTVLEALGLEGQVGAYGISLWPHLVRAEELPDRLIAAEGTLYGPELKTGIQWPHKIIVQPNQNRAWLFNLDADFREMSSIQSEQIGKPLRERLALRLLAASDNVQYEGIELDPELRRQLRSLGYIR